MKIGEDFPKISWHIFDLELLEPNAFFGDLIISMVALYFGFKVHKIFKKFGHRFHIYWTLFFLITALTFFMGGLGHLLYNYWGVQGKYFAWFSDCFPCSCLKWQFSLFLQRVGDLQSTSHFLNCWRL